MWGRHSTSANETRYLFYMRVGGPQCRSGRVRKISPPTGIRLPERPACSKSLYRLRYLGPSERNKQTRKRIKERNVEERKKERKKEREREREKRKGKEH